MAEDAKSAAERGRALVDAFPHSTGWYLLPYEPADLLWNGNGAVHRFTLADLGAVLDELAELRERLGAPRVQYGVGYPDHEPVSVAPSKECARAWVEQYATLVGGNAKPARVVRRTVTRSTSEWQDDDE